MKDTNIEITENGLYSVAELCEAHVTLVEEIQDLKSSISKLRSRCMNSLSAEDIKHDKRASVQILYKHLLCAEQKLSTFENLTFKLVTKKPFV